ncbi:tyrosine-type recombinase/integrase [Candidatus Thiodiazotropha endoloripes]|uniref:Integrase n=1 Tax=Candidatus Thiodiazotropha endoloripes TaxID=1818881 RepID=A0A1E2UTE1_9GAMM|nr:site-specific integrase [Candidatus Thiodiazotropha endoloripes]MCG7983762.1 tyrosine-type recombinase/integrase [Candidatus Thiodiazotropha lotti]ODB98016.1 integrase [Candidatus Thiodiazotropha endoloripes]
MAIHKLSPAKVKNAGPGKYDDGGGLKLVVSNAGAKKWVLRFTINGKRREMGLGSYPDTKLGEARNDASDYRKLVTKGVDPIEARRIEQVEIPTFTTCAARYIKAHRRGWKNAKHARQWVSTLKTYARPKIGTKKVDAITTEDILKILQPIWTTKTETAKRLQGRIENILDFAAAHKYRSHLNPARWRGHLDKLLAKPSRVKKASHLPAMPYFDVPAFMMELAKNGSNSALALQFLILTATRTSEVLQAKWDEIDLDKGVWIIPAERMKTRREHRVPLLDAALSILAAVHRIEGNPYLFPGSRHGRPLSNMALLQLMRGMGYGVNGNRGGYVPHGFRSSFRDWSGEISSFPRDVAEMALAHAIKNKVEAAYRRGDLFEKRREMMQEWADYLENLEVE